MTEHFPGLKARLDPSLFVACITLPILQAPGKPAPRIWGKIAGEQNPGYLNAMLAKSKERPPEQMYEIATGTQIAGKRLRDDDRELYPHHVITKWEHVYSWGEGGEVAEVPYSVEACVELFQKLPGDTIGQIRRFFSSIENFVGSTAFTAKSLAGN